MKIHQKVMKIVIERDNSVSIEKSDLIVTCFGNDATFFDHCDTEVQHGSSNRVLIEQ